MEKIKCELEKTGFGKPFLKCQSPKLKGIPITTEIIIDMRSGGKAKTKNIALVIDEFIEINGKNRGRTTISHMRLSDLKELNRNIGKFIKEGEKTKPF